MTIKELTAAGLEAFIKSEEFAHMPVIPISRHRAISQIHNPRLAPDDIIMFLAYEDEKMIGYLGVLPDRYYYDGQVYKTGWLSCFWVDPDKRGKGISKALGMRAVEKWQCGLFATEFTLPSKRLWLKINALEPFLVRHGIRGFLRFNLEEILPRKKPVFKKVKTLLRLADKGLNIINEKRLSAKLKSNSGKILMETLSIPDMESLEFIGRLQTEEIFKREAEDFNWIMKYPWILPREKDDGLGDKYYFTSYEQRFEFKFVKIRDRNKKLIAVLLLSIRNKHLKTQYVYLSNEDIIADVMEALYKIMYDENISTFTTYSRLITTYLENNKTPFISMKAQLKEYLVSKTIINKGFKKGGNIIQDGDGDCVFT